MKPYHTKRKHNWEINTYDDDGNKKWEFIDIESIGIENYEDHHTDYIPLEDMQALVLSMPYPDPFEVLTIPEAVFQEYIRDVIKPMIKDMRMKSVSQDHNLYGPIYIEEFFDTDEFTNISIIHEWSKIDGVVRYLITVHLHLKK